MKRRREGGLPLHLPLHLPVRVKKRSIGVASAHDVARGLVSDVGAVEMCRTPRSGVCTPVCIYSHRISQPVLPEAAIPGHP